MLSLGEIAGAIPGARLLLDAAADIRIERVSTDSRTIGAGALFVALRGPRFDGHDYIDAALERGASAVLCERAAAGETRALVVVPDALLALQQLATHWRRRWRGPLIAVTGSNG
ncbi:MAG: Mur ligase domain-containing protein, partial [Gammaproteobacteria bacterium]